MLVAYVSFSTLCEQNLTSLAINCFQPWLVQNEHGWNIHHERKRSRR